MAYTIEQWGNRIKSRSDLSVFLYHLTRGARDTKTNAEMTPVDVLLKIIGERRLIGSSEFIIGRKKAVCFQDTPIYSLLQNVTHEADNINELGGKIRYTSVGLAFFKTYIFQCGGRPVFYETKIKAKKILPEEEWWRIVDYNLTNRKNMIDWTHEREWRIPTDEFCFELPQACILLPDSASYKQFIERVPSDDLNKIYGIVLANPLVY